MFWSNAPTWVESEDAGPGPPDGLIAGGEGGVSDLDRHRAGDLGGQVAAADVAQLVLGVAVFAGGDRPQSRVGAVAVDHQQQPLGEHLGWEIAAGTGRGDRGQGAGAQHGLLEQVDQRDGAPPVGDLLLEPAQVGRLRDGLERGQLDGPAAPLGDVDPAELGQRFVEDGELGGHLLAELVDERARVEGFPQRGVVLDAALVEVGGQVLVGVAPPFGAGDPDVLAAQSVAQGLEGDDLIRHPHHPAPSLAVGAEHQRLPVPAGAPVDGDGLTERVVLQPAGRGGDELEGGQHRLVGAPGAKLEHLEEPDQAAPVVVGVRGAQRGLDGALVDRALGLVLVDQLAQRLLAAGHGRIDDLPDGVVGRGQGRGGDREQDVLLAGDPLEGVDEFLGDSAVGAGGDPVHRGNQQVDQGVGELAFPGGQQRREQGQPQLLGVAAQM